jgi:hypothetical protein
MLIARRNQDGTFTIAHHQDLFPDTSFSDRGPNADWFLQNDCFEFSLNVPYDADTQELVLCDPYLQDGMVYNRRAQHKPAP